MWKTLWANVKHEAGRLYLDDGGWVQALIPIITGIAGAIASKRAKNKASGGATMEKLMPLMMSLMNQQRTQQTQRHQANMPIEDSIRSMVMRMSPRGSQMPMGRPISQQSPFPVHQFGNPRNPTDITPTFVLDALRRQDTHNPDARGDEPRENNWAEYQTQRQRRFDSVPRFTDRMDADY